MYDIGPHLPRIKNALHGLQAFCILIGGILDIVFMVRGKFMGGAIIYYLILCFITAPAIIYNSMTLWFVRSRRWGNAYVFAVLDVLFAILWLAAFASVAAFNGQTGFLKEDDAAATEEPAPATAEEAVKMLMRRIMSRRRDVPADNDAPAEEQKPEGVEMPTCTGACGVTKAMVGFGFFIFFFFVLTAAISIKNMLFFRSHGSMPLTSEHIPQNASMLGGGIDPDRDAFNSDLTHDDFDHSYAPARHSDDDERMGGYGHDHRRASNDLYSGGVPMEGGRYGLGSLPSFGDSGGNEGSGRTSAMGGRVSAMSGGGLNSAMPYEPDSFSRMDYGAQDTSYGGPSGSHGYVPPRVDDELGNGGRTSAMGRVNFPTAPYGA